MTDSVTYDEMSDPRKYSTPMGKQVNTNERINRTHSMNCSMDITCLLSLYEEFNSNQQLEHPS